MDADSLRIPCSDCGALIPVSARFCLHCGREIVNERTTVTQTTWSGTGTKLTHRIGSLEHVRRLMDGGERLPSERRFVTTLFADVVDSTFLAEMLDPEDVTAIMNEAFRVFTEPVRRYEGTLARLMGDGVLCLFGAPLAHEDDPARGCRAALEIVRGTEQLANQLRDAYGLDSFEVRIGISTGLAVVGEVGTESLAEYTAMGDAVNLASRLQGAAEPDSILICGATQKQVKRVFETEDLGLYEMKGKAASVRAYRLIGLTAQADRDYLQAPFVGRAAELDQVKNLLSDMQQNRGSSLLISGGAGIGKSRLLREAREAVAKEMSWAEIRCHSYTKEQSYGAARGMLQSLLGIEPLTSPRLARQQLSASLDRIACQARSLPSPLNRDAAALLEPSFFACMAYLLRIPMSDEEHAVIQARKGEALQNEMRFVFRHYVVQRAAIDPLVLVWEDTHWIDPQSLDLLTFLAPVCDTVALLIICTARPEIGSPWPLRTEWAAMQSPMSREICLSALNTQASTRLLHGLFGEKAIPEGLTAQLLSTAGGNPYFLEEIARDVIDAGIEKLQHRTNPDAQTEQECLVPTSVQAVILSRIDRLAFQQKKLLQVASVAREAFLRDVLTRVLTPVVSPEEVDDALWTLEKKGLIQRISSRGNALSADWSAGSSNSRTGHDDESSLRSHGAEASLRAGDKRFAFAHAMIADVVYQSLLRTERKRLHQLVGETLETFFCERVDEFAPALAHQFERAGDAARAVRYLFIAGGQSAEVFSLDAARDCYTRALQLAASCRQRSIDPHLVRRISEALGDVHYFCSAYEEALRRYDEALAVETDSTRRATLLRKKGNVLEKWGRYALAHETFQRGLDVMESAFDEREAGRIYTGMCLVQFHRHELARAAELAELALQMNEKVADEVGVAEACSHLGVVLARRGERKDAERHYRRAQRIYKRIDNRYGLATCYNNRGVLASNEGQYNRALRWFRKSARTFEALGNQHGVARAYDNMGQALYRNGDQARSEKYLEKAVQILAELSSDHATTCAELWQSGIW